MLKKIFASVIAMTLVISTFAACGGNSTNESGSATASSSSESQGGETSDAGTANDGWTPIGSPDAPVDVHVVVKDVFPDEDDVKLLVQAVNEKMAAHGQYVNLIFDEPPASGYAGAMPLAVMNGEISSDLIYFQGGDQQVSAQGLLVDWTPYIENSQFIKGLMDESNVAKLESYPYLLWLAPPRVSTPVVRSDWAAEMASYDALVNDPTPDNYYAFFKELVDSGKCKYALTLDDNIDRINTMFNHAFGVTGQCVQEDGKWIFSKASQAEKEKLAFFAKLYKDGLLDPDFVTNDWAAMEQKFYDGEAAVVAGTAGAVIKIYDDKMQSLYGADSALVVLPPAKGVSQSYLSIDVTKESRGFGINADSENIEAAVAVLDFMASPEGRILDKVGIEGIHYNVENNQIKFTDLFTSWWSRFWETTRNFNPDPALAEPVYTPAAQDSLDQVNKFMVMDHSILIPEELATQWDAMTQLYNEFSTNVIKGTTSIDEFDKFVEDWNKAGGDAFESVLQDAFN